MPKINVPGMNVEALIDLQKRVDALLRKHRAEIEKDLERMNRAIDVVERARVARRGGSSLKGKKVPPKYRSRSGETWAGRGAKPHWLVDAIKGGREIDDFLIDKSAQKKNRRWKR